jgi:hypothetical protein
MLVGHGAFFNVGLGTAFSLAGSRIQTAFAALV